MSDCRVALLTGGKSGEREVSLASGKGAREALEEAGFTVTSLDPAEKEDLKRLIDGPFDVAFLCLHGKWGEDGTVQGFLETIGLPYIGSGVWSSALAMDKVKSKLYYERDGIPTPPSVSLQAGDSYDVEEIVAKLGEHCVVKPGTEGSALGVFIVEGAEAVAEAIEKAFAIDSEILIERYIKGKELTVAVIGDDEVEALPIIEMCRRASSTITSPSTRPVARSTCVPRRCRKKPRVWCRIWPFARTERCHARVFPARISSWKTTAGVGRLRRTPFRA